MPGATAKPDRPGNLSIECVLLSSFASECTFLQNVLRSSGIRMHHAESLDEADFLLTVTGATVLLSDVIFEGGYWQSALALLQGSHPLIPMLVIADPVDRPYIADIFVLGACGVVWKPFQFGHVSRQIRAAHEAAGERRALLADALAATR